MFIAVVAVIGAVFIGLPVLFGSWTIVSPQEKAIVVRLGSIKGTLESGFNFKMPIIDKVVKMDISTNAIKGTELGYSKDGQTVTFEATMTYALNPGEVENIYKEYRKDYESRVILPAIKEAIKTVASKYTAQGIIENRAKLSSEMKDLLAAQVVTRGFIVEGVVVTNIDFDDAYEAAIQGKQIAEQNALKQVNVTKQEEELKKQEILKAEALAEKTRLESEALASQQGEKVINKIYAEAALEAAKKWNGVLPTQMIPGQTLPFIQLGK
jgi:regulator of protease activity HflC (stomatin/prohibitin superfamily)